MGYFKNIHYTYATRNIQHKSYFHKHTLCVIITNFFVMVSICRNVKIFYMFYKYWTHSFWFPSECCAWCFLLWLFVCRCISFRLKQKYWVVLRSLPHLLFNNRTEFNKQLTFLLAFSLFCGITLKKESSLPCVAVLRDFNSFFAPLRTRSSLKFFSAHRNFTRPSSSGSFHDN